MKPILYEKLIAYKEEEIYPFHMPGHKRKINNEICNPYELDITEITGFDNLNDPKEILKQSMEEAAKFYHTKRTYYLVNGSTSGILASITAVCNYGDKILMARNCHKAVYNAVRILGLIPIYLPLVIVGNRKICGGIDEIQLQKILKENPDIKAVIVTSPTYEGIVMNIEEVKMCIKQYKIPLIVDEAHGAHFPYLQQFPKSAIEQGADLVIQSVHKTMPSFTQTALLHLCSDVLDAEWLQDCISIYQTSSPSYVLMAGIEYAISYGSTHKEKFEQYFNLLQTYREKFSQFSNIHLLSLEDAKQYRGFDYDPCRLVFFFENTNRTGEEIASWLLREHNIELEMSEREYVIAISTVMDEEKGFAKLYEALKQLDLLIEEETTVDSQRANIGITTTVHKMCYKPAIARKQKRYWKRLEESEGEICGDYLFIYPPGIPLLVAGEQIRAEDIALIHSYIESGFAVKGVNLEQGTYQVKVLERKGGEK